MCFNGDVEEGPLLLLFVVLGNIAMDTDGDISIVDEVFVGDGITR